MNQIQRELVNIGLKTTKEWERNFSTMPEVWIGLARPQYRLNETERLAARIAVSVARVILETVAEKYK